MDLILIDLLDSSKVIGLCPMGILILSNFMSKWNFCLVEHEICFITVGPDQTYWVTLTHLTLVSFLLDIGKQCRPRSDATKRSD